MPDRRPPRSLCGEPRLLKMPVGTGLWRVHQSSVEPAEFSGTVAESPWVGGRFDGTPADPFPYLYAGYTAQTALCETLLRGLEFMHGGRHLMRTNVKGRVLSGLFTTCELTLLSMVTSADLASLCQPDGWLVQAEGLDYAGTRDWAAWLRHRVGEAQGLMWCSRWNMPKRAMILFGDRCPPECLISHAKPVPLDDQHGARLINHLLARYKVTISPPQ